MELVLVKAPSGALIPIDDSEAEKLKRWKAGSAVRGEFKLMRNGAFHRKMFALLNLCYEHFKDMPVSGISHNGATVTPSFDVFRDDLVILSGHYTAHYGISGEVTLKAKSLSFASCSQEDFERIYSSVIDAALRVVYDNSKSEQWLRSTVDQILSYT
jgi:hypothetical protein